MKEKAQQKLQQLQQQLVTSKSSELERLYATRYHKVRGLLQLQCASVLWAAP